MSEGDIDKIIFLYLAGEANLEEIQKLRRWLNADSQNKETLEKITEYWNLNKLEAKSETLESAYSELIDKIHYKEKGKTVNLGNNTSRKPHRRNLLMAAAAIAVLITTFVFISRFYSDQITTTTEEISMVVKQNPVGQKSTIRLPDGTTVWLNAESSISYPQNFNGNVRRVKLSGEAFFDVTKDKSKPFVINAEMMEISVLGTKFNVKAFPEDNQSNVSLVSGKVKLSNFKTNKEKIPPVFLEPGEEIEYDLDEEIIVKREFDIGEVTAWKDGVLVLNNDSFDSFIHKIERWYGVEVNVIGQPAKDFIVTGKFKNENMDNVLRALQYSRDFEYLIDGKYLTLKFQAM